MIGWYDGVAAGLERTVLPQQNDEFAVKRWEAHGYQPDPASLGDTGSWGEFNERDLTGLERPARPDGFRFRTAAEAGPRAAVQAHVDAWAPSSDTPEGYEGVRRTAAYRSDLHVLVEAADGTMADQAFGIVAVNGGLANTTNPCLDDEISWAVDSAGGTRQPRVSLYVNTAEPGNKGVTDWPVNNLDPLGH